MIYIETSKMTQIPYQSISRNFISDRRCSCCNAALSEKQKRMGENSQGSQKAQTKAGKTQAEKETRGQTA